MDVRYRACMARIAHIAPFGKWILSIGIVGIQGSQGVRKLNTSASDTRQALHSQPSTRLMRHQRFAAAELTVRKLDTCGRGERHIGKRRSRQPTDQRQLVTMSTPEIFLHPSLIAFSLLSACSRCVAVRVHCNGGVVVLSRYGRCVSLPGGRFISRVRVHGFACVRGFVNVCVVVNACVCAPVCA